MPIEAFRSLIQVKLETGNERSKEVNPSRGQNLHFGMKSDRGPFSRALLQVKVDCRENTSMMSD